MSNIPAASEFFYKSLVQSSIDEDGNYSVYDIQSAMIEFAKIHVEAALKAATEKANMIGETQHDNGAPNIIKDFVYVVDQNGPDYGFTVNKDSFKRLPFRKY